MSMRESIAAIADQRTNTDEFLVSQQANGVSLGEVEFELKVTCF